MQEIGKVISSAMYFGVFISIAAYFFGMWVMKKTKIKFLNPLLISVVIVIPILILLKIDYKTYNETAKYLTYLLTPTTACLAIPLYEKLELLKKNKFAVIAGIGAGVIANGLTIMLICFIFGLSHVDFVTLLPKSVTTAIGVGISEELGGNTSITAATVAVTGITGNIIAPLILKLFKITHPVACGLALGTSSHAIGTAKAYEIGETEGAVAGLAIGVTGIMTVGAAYVFSLIY